MADQSSSRELIEHSCGRLEFYLGQIERCARLLTTDELWYRPNEHVNSVANLMLHLLGNVRQWVVHGLGGEEFHRDRPAEFAARDGRPAIELVDSLGEAVHKAMNIIRGLDESALSRQYTIQKYAVSGQTVILHVVEHFAFHTGQIIHATKWLKDVDLSLYDAQGQRVDRSKNP